VTQVSRHGKWRVQFYPQINADFRRTGLRHRLFLGKSSGFLHITSTSVSSDHAVLSPIRPIHPISHTHPNSPAITASNVSRNIHPLSSQKTYVNSRQSADKNTPARPLFLSVPRQQKHLLLQLPNVLLRLRIVLLQLRHARRQVGRLRLVVPFLNGSQGNDINSDQNNDQQGEKTVHNRRLNQPPPIMK